MDIIAKVITYFFLVLFGTLIGLPVISIIITDPFFRILVIISGLSVLIYSGYCFILFKPKLPSAGASLLIM